MNFTRKLQHIAATFAAFVALLGSSAALATHLSFPPSPLVKAAINPITNKVYFVDEFANSVTVLNAATNTTTAIPVGPRPQFIVVNPATNRVYVNNAGNATITVIDGATDTNLTPTPLPVGSQGPMAVNPLTNMVYIVRMTGLGTDEVTYFNAANNTWYTIATESFQPTAVAVNPATNTLYVAHYGTGDVRIISAANDGNAHPVTSSLAMWSHPFAIAANPVTNRIYVLTEDSRGPIAVINGATRTVTYPAVAAGHAVGPKALAVNPVTNRIYAAFNNEVIVIDGATNAYTYIPVSTGSGPISVGVNYITNKIYVAASNGTLTIIDGATNATASMAVTSGASSIAVNPITNRAYVVGDSISTVVGGAGETVNRVPLDTAITPLPSNTSPDGNPTFTFTASSGFTPTALPVRAVYYQLDSTSGPWTAASGSGPFTATFSGLAQGAHTLYAFAADGQDAPIGIGPQSNPLVGNVTSYAFTVAGAKSTASVSLASSANPAASGQSVTFTSTVSGASGTPTGSVNFRDGSVSIGGCAAVALTNGSAACTTSTLAAGSHPISASYSGNATYNSAVSGTVTQTINAPPPPPPPPPAKTTPTVALASSADPASKGQTVTFTATISGSGPAPTGTVAFRDGAAAIAGCTAVAVSGAKALCSTATLSQGSHNITAQYSGDAAYNTATSNTFKQNIKGK